MDDEFETESILGSSSSPQPFYHYAPVGTGGTRQSGPKHRDYFVLALHLSGHKAQDICELVGLSSPQVVYNILRKKEIVLVRQQLLEGLELEFEALQKEVFKVIEEALKEPEPRIRLEAVDKWFRYFGKYQNREDKTAEITAEDVVQKLLQINVQVNVGEK